MRTRIASIGLTSALTLAVTLAATLPARAGDHDHDGWDWDSWADVLADFFMGPQKKAEFRWNGHVAPGSTLEIKGVNGRVSAEPASGREVELVALKRGRRHDPGEVEIKVVEHPGGVTICALYPSPDGGEPNQCQPGRQGRMKVRNNDVAVEWSVKVPAGVAFVGRTVNGSIKTARLAGDVEAYTVNGSVRVTGDGHARAETVNGSIHASLGKTDWREGVAFKTVNGSVTLTLPADASTGLRVETVNGSISNAFSLTGESRVGRRQLAGTIGRGGRELLVKTVNGSVTLRQGT